MNRPTYHPNNKEISKVHPVSNQTTAGIEATFSMNPCLHIILCYVRGKQMRKLNVGISRSNSPQAPTQTHWHKYIHLTLIPIGLLMVPPYRPMRMVPPYRPMRMVPPYRPMRMVPPYRPMRMVPPYRPMRMVPPYRPMRMIHHLIGQ